MPTHANEPCHRSPATSNSLRNFFCATISPLNKLLGLYECCVVLGFYKQPLQCFFSPPNLRVRWVGDPLQEDLAKFGYRSKRKVEKFRICALFWRHAKVYCLNMAISKKKNPHNVVTLGYFFPQKKGLCISGTHIGFSFVAKMPKFIKNSKHPVLVFLT